MQNLYFHENVKYVPAGVPLDITGAGFNGDWVSLKNAYCCAIILQCGAWAGGTAAVTVEQAVDVAGTSGKAVSFSYQWTGTALTADTLTKTAVTSNTFNLATANKFHIIEIPAATLDVNNSFDCLRVVVATPGSNADLVWAGYFLYPVREKGANMPSAIID